MTEFELLVIPLSLILGLGTTSLLWGFIRAIRHREDTKMDIVPLLWALGVLLYTVGYFNVLYDLNEQGQAWTWRLFGPVLFQTLLIFLSAGLIFPTESQEPTGSMLADFEKHGRFALIPLLLFLGGSPFTNRLQSGIPWLDLANLFNVLLSAVLIMALASRKRVIQVVMPLAFLVLTIGGMMGAWSQPGTS